MQKFEKHLPQAWSCLVSARQDGAFPAFSAGVFYKGSMYFGWEGCNEQTFFDLASLTKPLVTTTLCALAEMRGLLKTEGSLEKVFPHIQTKNITVAHLLNHCAGLPAWLPLYESVGKFDGLRTPPLARQLFETKILESLDPKKVNTECIYSDLGFMLLGWYLEKTLHAPLDSLFQEWVTLPCGYTKLQFLPLSPHIAPTEHCPWRGHILRGEVHDENCYALGGVAGHSGLFGTVQETLALSMQWLKAYAGHKTLLYPEVVQKYWNTKSIKDAERCFGWDGVTRKSDTPSSTGHFFSDKTRGHLGFTGTSLWMDPERDLAVLLLTNRIHPSRQNEKIKTVRPQFHDAVISDLG